MFFQYAMCTHIRVHSNSHPKKMLCFNMVEASSCDSLMSFGQVNVSLRHDNGRTDVKALAKVASVDFGGEMLMFIGNEYDLMRIQSKRKT